MSGVALDTPLAEALSNVVHTKITEEGWSQEDDTSLAEYIVLMLVNGKTQDQIASELASELLQDVDGIPEFAQWLSEQVEALRQSNNTSAIPSQPASSLVNQQTAIGGARENGGDDIPAAYDADMGDAAPDNAYGSSSKTDNALANHLRRPRGPKGMHGGRPSARGGRGQITKPSDRSGDSALHRVRPQSGTERINSHMRGAPKGPRSVQNQNVRPGMQKALAGMTMSGPTPPMQNPMMQNGGQPGQPMMPMTPMTPQQQMEFMAMMEQQARMMAQFTGMVPPVVNPGFQQNGVQQQNTQSRSLFDRVESGSSRGRGGTRGRGRGAFQNGAGRNGAIQHNETSDDTAMDGDSKISEAPPAAMDAEQSIQAHKPGNPAATMCRFNLRCINKDCPYVHQSPAAPDGTTIDMDVACPFGAGCKNSKCVGKHPSPASFKARQSEEMCKFHPYCTNPTCPYKHPSMPMCKNGADCKVENCKFTHLQTPCRFTPCLNPRCPYKHAEGQKGAPANVWTPKSAQEKAEAEQQQQQHVSERKFVAEDEGEEELIKPDTENGLGQTDEVVT